MCTLRNKEGSFLAIEFEHRGKKWKADTSEEAIRLRRELEEMDEEEAMYGGFDAGTDYDERLRAETVWTADVFWNFVKGIGQLQTAIVMALLANPRHGITSSELVKALKLPDEVSLAGALSGLSKQLKRLELKPAHLYTVNTTWTGDGKTRRFFVHRAFELAAEELGWPEAEKKEGREKNRASAKKNSK